MNHPPKKQRKNPLLPDDQQVDERNLIDLEDSVDISFEDRATVYWQENKGFLIGCILILLLIVVGYQGIRILKEQREIALQNEYIEATENDTLPEFARLNSDKVLGGFAALKVADAAYTDEDYEKAIEFYGLAVATLEDPIIAGLARLGQAFALYYGGETEESLARLNAITADNTLAETIRAEAAYHLAIDAHAAGRAAEFSGYTAQINNSKFAVQWQQRLRSLPAIQVAESE